MGNGYFFNVDILLLTASKIKSIIV